MKAKIEKLNNDLQNANQKLNEKTTEVDTLTKVKSNLDNKIMKL